MKWLKSIMTVIGITITGMWGGQRNKTVRRAGIPILALTFGGFSRRAWPLVLLMPLLSVGYGESSWLAHQFNQEWLIRSVYACMLSLPFLFYGIKRWGISALLMGIVFQIHAGSLGHIGNFDILVEDILRYGVLGGLTAFNLFF